MEGAARVGVQRSPLILSLQVKAGKSLTSGTAAPLMPLHCSGITTMAIETTLFLVFGMAVGTATVKILEWRQDVLYGPHLARQRSEPNRPR